MCSAPVMRGGGGGGAAGGVWGVNAPVVRGPIVLLAGAYGETLDKRRGGKVGIQKLGPKSARLQMFGDELVEEFAALRTDQEVRTFEVHGTVITKQALNNSWPLEEYLDDILTTHRYIVKELPRDLTRLYAEALLMALRVVRDFPEERRAWAVYLTLPFLCLQTCQSFRATGKKMREMGLRLLRFIRGDIQNLYNEAVMMRQANKERRLAKESVPAPVQRGPAWSPQAAAYFREGRFSLAMAEMEQNGGDLHRGMTEAAQAVINEKLRHGDLPGRDLAADRRDMVRRKVEGYTATAPDMRKVIRRLDGAKAGGFSGHRHGHLKSALRHEGLRADLLSVIAEVVNVINRGRIPLDLVPYTHGGFGNIAGKKRLFVAMESLVRISDTVLQSKFLKDKGAKTLFKYNLGVGIPAAADVLASWLEKVLAEHSSVEDLVLIELDAHNMFLEIDRRALLNILLERHPELYPAASYYTRRQFVSFFMGEVLEDFTGGIPIGAGLSSLFASLVEEVVLARLAQEHGQLILGLKAYRQCLHCAPGGQCDASHQDVV